MASTGLVHLNLWDPREDRRIYMVWLVIICSGIVIGFGLDFPGFLKQRPPPPLIVHVHALVFVAWIAVLSTQILLIQTGRIALHRRFGIAALGLAMLMVLLGPATALTLHAQIASLPGADPEFLAINFVDIAGFALLIGAGFRMRRSPAAHKRLMMLATVSLVDPGFARISGALVPAPTTYWPYLAYIFYGNFILVGAMASWDLWKRGRLHIAFVIGATLLLASEMAAAALQFDPTWKSMAAGIVRAWGYSG